VGGDHFEERGLAAAVAADESDVLPGVNGEVDPIKNGSVAEGEHEVGDTEQGHGRWVS